MEDLRQQLRLILRDLYEERMAGVKPGDVFTIEDDETITLSLSDDSLVKIANALAVQLNATGGLYTTSTGVACKLKAGGGITSSATGLEVDTSTFVGTSTFNANTILKADVDNVPLALTVDEQTLVGRIASGSIAALSSSQVRTLLGLATTDSPTFVTVKCSGLTDDYIPYHVNDATGLANGPTKTNVDSAISLKHAIQHAITSTADHTSTATGGKMLKADANGLPVDATNTDTDVADAVSKKHSNTLDHTRSHALDGTSDHSIGGLTNTYLVKSDGTKLVPATNTDAQVSDAVTKAHSNASDHAAVTVSAPISLSGQAISLVNNAVSPGTVTAIAIDGTLAGNSDTLIPTQKAVKTYADTKTTLTAVKADADIASAISLKHTAGTDTALGAVGTKDPPIDADKVLYRDSTASDALVTSTWTQVKAFLKTYFDTLYNRYVHPNHSGDVTSVADGAQTIANDAVTYAKMQNVSATDKLLGRSSAGAGDVEEIACTAAGRALLDDAAASNQCTTLGLGTSDGPTFDHLHVTNNAAVGTLNVATFAVTVEAASTLNQDLTTDAGPTFGHIHLSSGQVGFPAAQSASADANTLDDYEEGSWSVTWANLTGSPAGTTGYYTKIGNLVYYTYNTGSSTISGTSNSVSFTLPFTTAHVSIGLHANTALGDTGTDIVWTDGKCYPSTFNVSSKTLVFSGTYHV